MSIQHLSTPITTGFGTTKYDTGWIVCNDWTNQHLGSTVGANLAHNLNIPISDLEIVVLISPDGTDGNSIIIGTHDYTDQVSGTITTGYNVHAVDDDNFIVQTGSSGIWYQQDASGAAASAANGWRYRVIVEIRRPTFVWIPDSWLPPTMIVEDVKAYNVAGGTFTQGADRTRDLNTVRYNTIAGASLAANQITLPPGTYEVIWSAPGYSVNSHFSLLYDTTGSAVLARGSAEFSSVVDGVTTRSLGNSVFTISVESVIEIRHRCVTTSGTTNGLGVQTTIATYDSIYSQIKLVRKDT